MKCTEDYLVIVCLRFSAGKSVLGVGWCNLLGCFPRLCDSVWKFFPSFELDLFVFVQGMKQVFMSDLMHKYLNYPATSKHPKIDWASYTGSIRVN